MNARIQQVLDGELARGELTAEERPELQQAESVISNVLASVPVRALPDLTQAVLGALPATARRRRSVIQWFFQPSLQLRPAYLLGVFVLLGLGFFALNRAPTQNVAHAQKVFIQFRLDAPSAANVSLAGDFTNWQPGYQMIRSEPGVWTVVVPLNPGVHDYAFIVDGERWTPDPMAPAVADGFGGLNSRLAVLAPENNRSM